MRSAAASPDGSSANCCGAYSGSQRFSLSVPTVDTAVTLAGIFCRRRVADGSRALRPRVAYLMMHGTRDPEPAMNPQEIRERIHRLVDRLPEEELPTARRVLEGLRSLSDPVLRALLDAPEEEPISEEERAALREAEEDVRRGRVRPLEEYLTEREE